jgi:hypothetical protein
MSNAGKNTPDPLAFQAVFLKLSSAPSNFPKTLASMPASQLWASTGSLLTLPYARARSREVLLSHLPAGYLGNRSLGAAQASRPWKTLDSTIISLFAWFEQHRLCGKPDPAIHTCSCSRISTFLICWGPLSKVTGGAAIISSQASPVVLSLVRSQLESAGGSPSP